MGPGPLYRDVSGHSDNFPLSTPTPLPSSDLNRSCYRFDGAGSTASQQSTLLATGTNVAFATGSFTVSCWVKYTTSFGANFPGLVTHNTSTSVHSGWYMAVLTASGTVGAPYFNINDGTNNAQAQIATAFDDNKWHLVVGGVDRVANLIWVTVDGGHYVSVSSAAVGTLPSANLQLGCKPQNTGTFDGKWIGHMRDVRAWSRSLSLSEIQLLFQSTGYARYRQERQWKTFISQSVVQLTGTTRAGGAARLAFSGSISMHGTTRTGGRGVAPLAVATGPASLRGQTRAGGRSNPVLTVGLLLSGTTRAGSSGEGTPSAINKLSASKLVTYAVGIPSDTRVVSSKLVTYAAAIPLQRKESASKLNTYVATTPLQGKLSASKLVTYAAVYPLTPTPPTFPAIPKGFPVSVKPVYANVAGGIPSGRDIRFPQQQLPIWEFEMNFEVLRDQTQNQTPYPQEAGFTDFIQLAQLFVADYGRSGRFLFDAWWDDSRSGQVIATGDGTTGNFVVVRTWGFGGLAFTEPVGFVNTQKPINVYFNTGGGPVLQSPATYFIQKSNILTFTAAPPSGAVITMDFWFYYLCQWATDDQMFNEFFKNIWNAKIKFRSVLQQSTPTLLGVA